jgi:shikimate dehydrogenase
MQKNRTDMTQKMGIIGWPLGHTMSPTLHNFLFERHGLDAKYEVWPTQPEELEAFVSRVREEKIQGVSVTIPHKQAVMKHLDGMSFRAKSVGAVNTLFWEDGQLFGENTDVTGLIAPLRALQKQPETALVLGAGGAARAAVAGLNELEIESVFIANRTRSKAETIAHDLAARVVDWEKRQTTTPDLIINTTPLGMAGDMQDMTPWPGEFPSGCVVYDIVYNPLRTRLLREAEQSGCLIIEGLEMFLQQGLAQFRLWTGQEPDPDTARELLRSALG